MPYSVGNRVFGDDELSDAQAYADEIGVDLNYISESQARQLSQLRDAFSEWDVFIQDMLEYLEDQASDDIDRVFLGQELQTLQDMFAQWEKGEITAEEFLAFEPDFILDSPGASDYWNGLTNTVSGILDNAGQQKLNDMLSDLENGEYVYGVAGAARDSGEITQEQFKEFQNAFNEYTGTQPGQRSYQKGEIVSGILDDGLDDGDQEEGPSDLIGEDDVFEVLYAIMSGRQGVPEGTSEELMRELESVLAGANQDQIDAIAQQILDAGGFDAWLSQRQGDRQQELADRLAEAAEEGPGALQDVFRDILSDFNVDPTMTVEEATQKAIDFIRKIMPENTPESILEDYIGTGIGVLWEDFGNIVWQQGQILIPGLPGLPIPSGMIKVGEIQDLLNDPLGAISDWSSDIWTRVLSTVTDPATVLSGIFGDLDSIPDGLANLILSGEVTQSILDWYNGLGDQDEEEEDTDLQSKLTEDKDEDKKNFLDEEYGELPGENPGDRDPDSGGDGDDGLDTVTVDEDDDDLLGETDPFESTLEERDKRNDILDEEYGELPGENPIETGPDDGDDDLDTITIDDGGDSDEEDAFEGDLPGATGPFPGKDKEIEEVIGGPIGGGDDDLDTITIDDGDGEDVFEGDLPGSTGPFPEKDKEIEEVIGGPIDGGGEGDDEDVFEGDLPGATGPFPEKDKEIEEVIGGPIDGGGGDGDTDELESSLEEQDKKKTFPDDEYGTDPVETDPDDGDDGGGSGPPSGDEELDPIEVTPQLPGGGGGMFSGVNLGTGGVDQYGISYQTPQLRQIVIPKKDYVAELDALIERSMFGKLI